MRILIFTQQFAAFRSGVGTVAFALAAGLSSRNHAVTVVVPKGEECEVPGINLKSVPKPRFDPTPGGWVSLGLSFSKIIENQSTQYDIVHFTDAREAWKVSRSNIPVTGRVNDAYAFEWFQKRYPRYLYSDRLQRSFYYGLLRIIEKRTYPRLNGLIATSHYVAKAVTKSYRLNPKKIRVVYYGLPNCTPASQIELKGYPAVLFVGANFQRKGLPVLLKAASLLKRRFPDICIHVVGKDRNQPALAVQARELGISDSICFHGWQPNHRVLGMMAGADIFAMPSFTEGFGIAYLEAMRVGTPVIATSIGGAKEVFRQDREVLFVNPGEVRELAAAIEIIASDPETADRLRMGGQAASTRFTQDATTEATEAFFLGLIQTSRNQSGM